MTSKGFMTLNLKNFLKFILDLPGAEYDTSQTKMWVPSSLTSWLKTWSIESPECSWPPWSRVRLKFEFQVKKCGKLLSSLNSTYNVWCIKNRTKLSNVLLLCLVRFLMHQTLLLFECFKLTFFGPAWIDFGVQFSVNSI